jgi:uncharacterized protein YoxC
MSVLLGIIIALVSVNWGDKADLVQHITFASTLTSLFLALIAIIYAFFVNFSFSDSLGSIRKVSEEMSKTTNALTDASQELRSQIESIPALVSDVRSSITENTSVVKELSQKMGSPKTETETPSILVEAEDIKVFLSKISRAGLIALFACAKSHSTEKPFDMKDIFARPESYTEYTYGFLSAVDGTDILDIDIVDGSKITVYGVPKDFLRYVEDEYDKRIQRKRPARVMFLETHRQLIEKYFREDDVDGTTQDPTNDHPSPPQ